MKDLMEANGKCRMDEEGTHSGGENRFNADEEDE